MLKKMLSPHTDQISANYCEVYPFPFSAMLWSLPLQRVLPLQLCPFWCLDLGHVTEGIARRPSLRSKIWKHHWLSVLFHFRESHSTRVTENVTRYSSLQRLRSSLNYKSISTADHCVVDIVACFTVNVLFLHEHDFQVKDVEVPCCSIYLKQTNKPLLLLPWPAPQRQKLFLSWPADSSAKCLISCLSWVTASGNFWAV